MINDSNMILSQLSCLFTVDAKEGWFFFSSLIEPGMAVMYNNRTGQYFALYVGAVDKA